MLSPLRDKARARCRESGPLFNSQADSEAPEERMFHQGRDQLAVPVESGFLLHQFHDAVLGRKAEELVYLPVRQSFKELAQQKAALQLRLELRAPFLFVLLQYAGPKSLRRSARFKVSAAAHAPMRP